MDTKHRLKNIFDNIKEGSRPEAIFLFNRGGIDSNFFYVTGIYDGVFENCGVLFDEEGTIHLFTSELEEEMARTEGEFTEVAVYGNEQERNQCLKREFAHYRKVGICYNRVSYAFYLCLQELAPHAAWLDVDDVLKMARMIKTEDEIVAIRKACSIASEVADTIPRMLKEGMTELDLSAEIDYRLKRSGAHGSSFKTIVAFGENSSKPHYTSSSVPLKNGDVVLTDFGALFKGYTSDITQTYLTGRPSNELIHLYNTVYTAQKRAIEMIRAGENAEHVEKEIRQYIDSHEKYKGRFIHRLGHSLGVDVHDDSYPSHAFDKLFSENMVLTVEPGIYLPGMYGVRLEDDIVVTKKGSTVLTTANKELTAYEIQ